MYCKECGAEIEDGANFCGECGTDLSNSANDVQQGTRIQPVEKDSQYASQPKSTADGVASNVGEKLQTNRSMIRFILLGIVTLGIYMIYVHHKMAKDVNVACAGDGENTSEMPRLLLLGIVTLGVYFFIWYYKLGNRLAKNALRYGLSFKYNGTIILSLMLGGGLISFFSVFLGLEFVGSAVSTILSLYAMEKLISNTNAIYEAYNKANNL